jgi:hypothetical protein
MKKIIIGFLFLLNFNANAQFEFHYPSWYKDKTYQKLIVKVGDQSNPYTQKIMQIIKDNWNVCPIEFYTDKFDKNLLVDGNIFLNFERYTIASQYVRDYGNNGGISRGNVNYNDYYYLNFWVIDKSYKPKKDWWDYKYTIAKSEFYLKLIGMGEEEYKAFKIDLETLIGIRESVFRIEREEMYPKEFDFTGLNFQLQYLNGMEGNIKNMIQFVNNQVKNKAEKDFFSDTKNESELSKLKKETLFIPNYWYGEKGTILENLKDGDKYISAHIKFLNDLQKSYLYKSEVITRTDLDKKILNANKDFYYLNYVQSSADKIISIINGKTGEVIYSSVTKNSYRLKEKDLEKIEKLLK